MSEKLYSIQSLDEIVNGDNYIKDFEEVAQEYCHCSAEGMALSVFREFSADMECSVYLDSKQTKGNYRSYEFKFSIDENDGELVVSYTGVY
ncbi:hypothetical protein P5F33_09770 [Clostridium perfringens]|uniref:hypothetical protein n=1 Tax=Clostridium perfringens TaxID=1502 RepID=UPI001A1EE6D2|nr:hypothetical protein [Clostridium perfringens]MBO3404478.1 hypothetical protein [Clostridium perfringens]MDK0875749.1 hypothetical protein [Clostridium perfringens]HAT4214933.1 hypothetical protein [Clostridium perfringens]